MAYGRKAGLTSGLLYSEGGVLCWSRGHAYTKESISMALKFKLFRYRIYSNCISYFCYVPSFILLSLSPDWDYWFIANKIKAAALTC